MSYRIRKIIKDFEEGNPPMDHGYIIISGSFFTSPVWYRENKISGQWEWTVDLIYWQNLDIIRVPHGISKGDLLSEDNLYFISYLKNKYLKKVLENCGMTHSSLDMYLGINGHIDGLINNYNNISNKNCRTRSEHISQLNEMGELKEQIYKQLIETYICRECEIIKELDAKDCYNRKYAREIIIGNIRNLKNKLSEIPLIDNARIHLIDEKNRFLTMLQDAQTKVITLENELSTAKGQIKMLTKQLNKLKNEDKKEEEYEFI